MHINNTHGTALNAAMAPQAHFSTDEQLDLSGCEVKAEEGISSVEQPFIGNQGLVLSWTRGEQDRHECMDGTKSLSRRRRLPQKAEVIC